MTLPDPGAARTCDEAVERLRELKIWAGDPSYDALTVRINSAWAAAGRPGSELARRGTVADCFKRGRRRLNADLAVAIVGALHPDQGYVLQWRQALRVISREAAAAEQVRAHDRLPDEPAGFVGRDRELRGILRTIDAAPTHVIEGMAGVGKTSLTLRLGRLLAARQPFDRQFFVDLRGCGPDTAQPPADPAAVLECFLRLLRVPGHHIPPGVEARTELFRRLLSDQRALIVLDNADDERQLRPLLPGGRRCLTLVTCRRRLSLASSDRLNLGTLTPDDAVALLEGAAADIPSGADPQALRRIARRSEYLPLALGSATSDMQAKRGWTLTDHADLLDERGPDNGHLSPRMKAALEPSYRRLPPDRRRLFRLLATHPADHFDVAAAAAIADVDAETAQHHLDDLCVDYLLSRPAADRYAFQPLVRAYATDRILDEERPTHRRAALARALHHRVRVRAGRRPAA